MRKAVPYQEGKDLILSLREALLSKEGVHHSMMVGSSDTSFVLVKDYLCSHFEIGEDRYIQNLEIARLLNRLESREYFDSHEWYKLLPSKVYHYLALSIVESCFEDIMSICSDIKEHAMLRSLLDCKRKHVDGELLHSSDSGLLDYEIRRMKTASQGFACMATGTDSLISTSEKVFESVQLDKALRDIFIEGNSFESTLYAHHIFMNLFSHVDGRGCYLSVSRECLEFLDVFSDSPNLLIGKMMNAVYVNLKSLLNDWINCRIGP